MQLERHCQETAELFGAINELWAVAQPGDPHQCRCLAMTAHCTQLLLIWLNEQADQHEPVQICASHSCLNKTAQSSAQITFA